MWISLRLLISCAARIQHLSAARSRISCVSFSRRTGFQSLSPGLHTDHRHRPGTSENTFLEFPLVIAAVAKVSRKRRLWPVVRVNEKSLHSQAFFRDFSSHILFQSTVGNFTETEVEYMGRKLSLICPYHRRSGRVLRIWKVVRSAEFL